MIRTIISNFKRNIRSLINSSMIRDSMKIATGNIVAQILAFVFTPILSRIYGPSLFGEFGVFTSSYNMVNGLVTLGLVSAILSPKEDKDASGIYKICALSSATFSILIFFILIVASPWTKLIDTSANYYVICLLLAFSLIVNNLVSMNYTWGNRQKAYKLLLWNPIIISLVNFAVAYLFAIFNLKQYGLVLGMIISQAIIFVYLFIKLKPLFYKNTFRELIVLLKTYSDFTKYQMTSNFIKGIASNMPILAMASFFGQSFVGQYNMGQRLLFMPIAIIGTSLGQVHFKRATDLVNQGKDPGELTYKTIKLVIYVCYIPFLIVSIFGNFIFGLFLGSEWKLSGTIVSIRAIEFIFTAMFYSTSYIFVVINKQRAALIYTIASLVFSLAALYIGAYAFTNSITTVILISAFNILLYITFYYYAFKYTEFGTSAYLKFISKITISFVTLQILGIIILKTLRIA